MSCSPHGSRFRGPDHQTLPKSPFLQTMVQLPTAGTCGGAGQLWLPGHYIRSRSDKLEVTVVLIAALWAFLKVFIIFKFYLLLLLVLLIIRASMQTGTDFRPLDVVNCRGNFGTHPLQSRLPPVCLHVCMHGLCICVECYNAWQEGLGYFYSAWSQWRITDCYEQPLYY